MYPFKSFFTFFFFDTILSLAIIVQEAFFLTFLYVRNTSAPGGK